VFFSLFFTKRHRFVENITLNPEEEKLKAEDHRTPEKLGEYFRIDGPNSLEKNSSDIYEP
jgi:hypothetical protein